MTNTDRINFLSAEAADLTARINGLEFDIATTPPWQTGVIKLLKGLWESYSEELDEIRAEIGALEVEA